MSSPVFPFSPLLLASCDDTVSPGAVEPKGERTVPASEKSAGPHLCLYTFRAHLLQQLLLP